MVHDLDTDKASASVNVNVGSFSDADDMPGMAHAVEHLLFMGTQKVRVMALSFDEMLTFSSFRKKMPIINIFLRTVVHVMHTQLPPRQTTSLM